MNRPDTPRKLITLDNAFERAFQRLAPVAGIEGAISPQVPAGGCDPAKAQELVKVTAEAARKAKAWATRTAILVAVSSETKEWFAIARNRAARARELAMAAEQAQAAAEMWPEPMTAGPAAQAAYDAHDAARDRVEALMRGALAGGDLDHPWVLDSKGQPLFRAVVDRDEWRRSSHVPGLGLQDRIDDLCPGPSALWGQRVALDQAEFEAWLARQVPEGQAAPAEAPRPAKRGRKAKYDWDAIREKTFELLDERGDFDLVKRRGWRAQADLERELLEYMADDGEEAGVSTLRAKDKLRAWIQEWREKQVSKGQ
jgi:hypothetical protein